MQREGRQGGCAATSIETWHAWAMSQEKKHSLPRAMIASSPLLSRVFLFPGHVTASNARQRTRLWEDTPWAILKKLRGEESINHCLAGSSGPATDESHVLTQNGCHELSQSSMNDGSGEFCNTPRFDDLGKGATPKLANQAAFMTITNLVDLSILLDPVLGL
jgi:hypothetical protein